MINILESKINLLDFDIVCIKYILIQMIILTIQLTISKDSALDKALC